MLSSILSIQAISSASFGKGNSYNLNHSQVNIIHRSIGGVKML